MWWTRGWKCHTRVQPECDIFNHDGHHISLSHEWPCFICFLVCPTTHTHSSLTALFPGLPGWAGTRKIKPIWISLKQETVSGSGISWAICKSVPRSRQITMPAPPPLSFFTGQMSFLPPNQQRQSTEGQWPTTSLKLCIVFWDGGETRVSIVCYLKTHTDLITVRG